MPPIKIDNGLSSRWEREAAVPVITREGDIEATDGSAWRHLANNSHIKVMKITAGPDRRIDNSSDSNGRLDYDTARS